VIVNNFYIKGIRLNPLKTDSPLIVDADAVLSGAVTGERLQPIAWNRAKVG
jgi:hypothetical protein